MDMIIRPGHPDDAAACADIHKRSWIYAYSHCIDRAIIEQRHQGREAMWKKFLANENAGNFVAVTEGKIIGIITIGKERDGDMPEGTGELCGLYLDPDYIGKGYGRQVMDWVKTQLKARGFSTMVLWVLDQNDKAKRFYEKSGLRPEGSSKPSGLGDRMEDRYIMELT